MAHAPARPRDLKEAVPDAPKILLRNVYGWFIRVERGVYALSDAGKAALVTWKDHLPEQSAKGGARDQKTSVFSAPKDGSNPIQKRPSYGS